MSEFITTTARETQDRKGLIRTFTGKYVQPLSMKHSDICIEDIAHHLSNECRFTGAVPTFYSVAQHSVLVSHMFIRPEMQLAALLHDASEAYLKDIPSPVKHDPRFSFYRLAEHELTRTIFEVFDLDPDLVLLVKEADDTVFRAEVRAFWGEKSDQTALILTPVLAEALFLQRFHEYRSAMANKESI